MMQGEQAVARHYTHGSLERTIFETLAASGKDLQRLTPSDLAPVDEFHIGGREATAAFAVELGVSPGMRLLDIGSGLGGPARYFALEKGCRVTGIDLTDEYVRVAEALSRHTGVADKVAYRQGSALELPFADGSFEGAYMLHVGMNIADKARLFAQVRRVLAPRGLFGIYDVMREGDGELAFPVPWAEIAQTSFVERPETYKDLLTAAGFEVLKRRSRRDFAIDVFRALRARIADSGPPPLGIHLLMGATAPQKIANMVAMIERGLIAPIEIVCRAG
jgi:SAM-dependent methyltransferase